MHVPTFQPESSVLKRDYLLHSSGLILSGQTTPALELLLSRMAAHPQGMPVLQSHLNSYQWTIFPVFWKGSCSCCKYEARRSFLPCSRSPAGLCMPVPFPIGFYVLQDNPKGIFTFQDLDREDVILANREKGSTRRIFLDHSLMEAGVDTDNISGYLNELVSDLSTASAVLSRRADVALGEEAVARTTPGLSFLPMGILPMYLVLEASSLDKPGFAALLEIIRSESFLSDLFGQTGYDVTHTGEILYL